MKKIMEKTTSLHEFSSPKLSTASSEAAELDNNLINLEKSLEELVEALEPVLRKQEEYTLRAGRAISSEDAPLVNYFIDKNIQVQNIGRLVQETTRRVALKDKAA